MSTPDHPEWTDAVDSAQERGNGGTPHRETGSVGPADRHGKPQRTGRRNGDQHDGTAARHGHQGDTPGEPHITGHQLINCRTRTEGPILADPVYLPCDLINTMDPAHLSTLDFRPPLSACGRHPRGTRHEHPDLQRDR